MHHCPHLHPLQIACIPPGDLSGVHHSVDSNLTAVHDQRAVRAGNLHTRVVSTARSVRSRCKRGAAREKEGLADLAIKPPVRAVILQHVGLHASTLAHTS
jgi:hypothetical protein